MDQTQVIINFQLRSVISNYNLNTYPYSHRQVKLSTLIKEASSCKQRGHYRDGQLSKMQRTSDLELTNPNWSTYNTIPTPRLRKHQKEGVKRL